MSWPRVQQAKITALIADFERDKLTLGAVREWVAALQHLPDDTRVASSGSSGQHPFNRPMSGGILEVVEYDGMDKVVL